MTQGMPHSPGKATIRKPYDVETAHEIGCADSCSSFDEFPRQAGSSNGSDVGSPTWDTPRSKHGGLSSMSGSFLSSGKLDSLDEEAALDTSPRDAPTSGWQLKCGRGASVAAVCLLLTLGSFVAPKSGEGLGSVMVSVGDLSSKARQSFLAARPQQPQQTDAAISRPRHQRHCLRQQLPQRDSTEQVCFRLPLHGL